MTIIFIRVYIPQTVISIFSKGGYLMDIFQDCFFMGDRNPPTFSEVFQAAQELKYALGKKGYLLEHYLSMFFHLVTQIDFTILEDDVYDAMVDLQKYIADSEINQNFHCQELYTKQELFLLSKADLILEQLLSNFLKKKSQTYHIGVDIIELQQTEEKIKVLIGQERVEAFQKMLVHRFLFFSVTQLFLQGIVIEFTKRFLTRDIETDQEIFRIHLNL